MALPEPLLLDEELENQCNEIRAIASKNWLSSAHSSLQHLDQIKASVYNVGIHDPQHLKATNLSSRGQRSQSFTDLAADPNAPPLSLQKNAIAWGSNGSIPDLLAQHSARSQTYDKSSARRTRPSSGKKLRPQSAKESQSTKGSQLPPRAPSIGVKGARVDPAGRPPKFVQHTSTGWVGPPAGLKMADDLPTDLPCDTTSSGGSPPPAPSGTPIPSEIKLGASSVGDYLIDQNEVRTTEPPKPPSPEPIHFSLPRMEDDYDEEDSDLDTERLLFKAEQHAPTPVVAENLPGFNYTHISSSKPTDGHLEVNRQDNVAETYSIHEEKTDTSSLSNHINTVPDNFDDLLDDDYEDDLEEDDWVEELIDLHHEEDPPFIGPNEKASVKFREDKNITIDITPRNLGYKVADMETHSKKKHTSPKSGDELKSLLSVRSTGPLRSHISLSEVNHDTKHTVELKSSQQSYTISKKPKSPCSALKHRMTVSETESEKRVNQERPKSVNKSSTPVATVTVAYSDLDDIKRVSKSRQKRSDKDVVTMVEAVLSDSEEEKSIQETDHVDEITPDKLEPWMPTKCVSEPPKNYYELSRRSSSVQNHIRDPSPPTSSHMFKTTKTIEFDEYKPKETSIKNVIDNSTLLKSRDRERFVGLDEESRVKVRPSSERPLQVTPKERLVNRPMSEMIQKSKSSHELNHSISKTGTLTKNDDKVKSGEKKMLRRPLSATSQRKSELSLNREESISKINDMVKKNENFSNNANPGLSEREKEIENLINKHLRRNDTATPVSKPQDGLQAQGEPDNKATEETEERKMKGETETGETACEQEKAEDAGGKVVSAVRQKSAPRKTKKTYEDIETLVSGKYNPTLGSKENKVNKIVLKMAETQVNAKLSDNTKHYASYSRSRVKSAPGRRIALEPKVRYTKPCFINSKIPDDDIFTEDEIEAHHIHQRLAAANVCIRPETLQRALYPPSGKTLYYDIENKLPRSTSASLLSHPKVWLPVEYKQFKLAEKNLNKANEIIRRQELAEERKARLAELGSAAKKKKGKKKGVGKKKGEAPKKKKSIC